MAKKRKKKPTPPPPPVARKPRPAAAPEGPTPKQQLRAARQRQERSESLRRRLVTAGLVLVVVAAVGLFVVLDRRGEAQLREALTAGSCEVDTEADFTAAPGRNHVPSPTFAVNPPAGGNHLPSNARSGFYQGAAVPADGQLVHSLEHGYVIAWYSPDLPEAGVEQLRDFEAEHDGDVLVVERPGLPVPVAATAWNRRLLCQQVEPATLERFFDEYVGSGPEDVRRG